MKTTSVVQIVTIVMVEIDVPQDRESSFQPRVIKKRQKDISDIDQKIISLYSKGVTTRQISNQIE